MDISIIIPVYNEEKNIPILHKKLKDVLTRLNKSYEIIYVDDGSTDSSFSVLKKIADRDETVTIIKLRKNFGQTSALDAGFKNSTGSIIITIDADLQNDPEDIPKLIEKLEEGFDVVSGWRYKRKDPFSKKIFSRISNYLRRKLTREIIHDSGCTLKAYKRICIKDLDLYGEMHRYIPTLLRWKGFKITEIKVKHYPRKYGKTKYNYKRLIRGLLDLLSAKFWLDYSTRPLHFFGTIGLLLILIGTILAILNMGYYLFILKKLFSVGPILLLSSLFILTGIQFLLFGFLADIEIKTYYSSEKTYNIEKIYKAKSSYKNQL